MKAKAYILCMMLTGSISLEGSLDFSIDAISPEAWNPGDVVKSLGDELRIGAGESGLLNADDVVGFSYGNDEIEVLADYNFVRIAYSVSRTSSGFFGLVANQNFLNGAAGDKFGLTVVNYRGRTIVLRGPYMISDAPVHNLTPKPDQSELDGMSLFQQVDRFPLYVAMSASSGYDPGSVYIIRAPGGPPEIFASWADLGLTPGDEIDALSVGTVPVTLPPPQSLGPGVVIWVSLKAGSPTRSIAEARGGDGVLQVYPGSPVLAIDALSLDLRAGDELDALTGLDPGEVSEEEEDLTVYPDHIIKDSGYLSRREAVTNGDVEGTVLMDRSSASPVALVEIREGPFRLDSVTIRGAGFAPDEYVEVETIDMTTEREKSGDMGTVYVTAQVNSTGFTIQGESTVEVPVGSTVRLKFALGRALGSALRWTGEFEILSEDPDYKVLETAAWPGGNSAVVGTGNHIQVNGENTLPLGSDDVPDTHFLIERFGGLHAHIADASAESVDIYSTDPFRCAVGVRLWDKTGAELQMRTYDRDGNEDIHTLPVNPDASEANPRACTVLLGLSIGSESKKLVLDFHEPLVSASPTHGDFAALEATGDGLAVAINVEDAFSFFGFDWGAVGQPEAYLMKIGAAEAGVSWESNPEIKQAIASRNSPAIVPRIVDIEYDESTGQLAIIQTSTTDITYLGDFTYYYFNGSTGATQLHNHSTGANFESSFWTVRSSDFLFTDSQAASVTGTNPDLNTQGMTFDRISGLSGKWSISGTVYAEGSSVQPGNILIPFAGQSGSTTAFTLRNVPGGLPLENLDSDGDGWPDRHELYLSSDPHDAGSRPLFTTAEQNGLITITTDYNPTIARRLDLATQTSEDLQNWGPFGGEFINFGEQDPTEVRFGQFSKDKPTFLRTQLTEKIFFGVRPQE